MDTALLLAPPITDPTSGYHSLVYLASHARAQGFPRITVRDTNIEALVHAARPESMVERLERWASRRRELAGRRSLSRLEQLEYLHLIRAQALGPDTPQRAMEALRDEERFYDYRAYRRAASELVLWLLSLSCDGLPGQFDRRFALPSNGGMFSPFSRADLADDAVLARLAAPFRDYFEEVLFPQLAAAPPALIGLNVTYTQQLPFALWLLAELRRRFPDVYLVVGGTEVSDVWKYARDPGVFADVFSSADACVVGEGETAFVELLEAVTHGRRPDAVPNCVLLDNASPQRPRIVYEDLDRIPTPDYDLLPQGAYLSPHPLVYYSPTRGCYWNRCTFCDYGLNFGTPTSPWRERDRELVLDDLERISRDHSFVYLSVDVLAPASIVKLAHGIVERGIELRWAAEMRLEQYFDRGRCDLLRESGCVAVSVGFESGCQRILDAIDKGTRLDRIETTCRSFADAGIAVQMMGFTGFPTETMDEAMESLAFLERNRQSWTVAGLGTFVLTPGAIVAQHTERFDLDEAAPLEGSEIHRFLGFHERSGPPKSAAEESELEEAKRALSSVDFDRPFAGGIDAPHSILYYDRYGRAFPREVAASADERAEDDGVPLVRAAILLPHLPYDPLSLFDDDDLERLHLESRRERQRLPDADEIRRWLVDPQARLRPVIQANPALLRRDGLVVPCSAELWQVLELVDGRRSRAEILRLASGGQAARAGLYGALLEAALRLGVIEPRQRDSAASEAAAMASGSALLPGPT